MPIPGNLLSATTEMVDPNTSGWTAKLNATLSKGIGGRNGDGCLVAKSIAVGEVQTRTVSSYPVAAGTVYQAFADSSGAVPERIGIRWMTAAGVEISITWSLTTTSASTSWHRVGVAGAAPVGATQAQVVLSSMEAGAAVNHFWENVYLGLPMRTTGNLLPFNTESSEVDTSGWVSLVNATISRQVPVVAWSATAYTVGGHTLAMTATAAGNAAVLAVDRPPVTPGVQYLAYAYLNPPVLSANAWLELRFYDTNGNQVGAQRSTLAAPGTGMYRQRASAFAPATAATCSVAAGLDGASAGQVLRLETVVVTAAPELQAGTVLPYADGSFEQGIAGWTKATGVATIAQSTPWGSAAWEGSYSLAVTSSTATSSVLRSARFPTPDAAGLNWRALVYAHPAAGTWEKVHIQVRWYSAAGADLGVSGGLNYILPGTSWYAMPTDAVAPAGAQQAALEITVFATATASVLNVDLAALWQVMPLTVVEAVDADGYIRLTLRELNLDYRISIYRETPDGHRALVRGPSGLIDRQLVTSDLMIIEDHEAPMNTPVHYRIEFRNPAGSLSTRGSDYVTVTLTDVNEAWLKDPGNPQRNLRVLVEEAPEWTRPIEQATHIVRGRRNKVVLSGTRQGLEGDLAIWTRTDAERQALHLLLDSGNVLLWQAVPGMGVSDMYVNVGQITEGRIGGPAQEPWRTWKLPLIEADMPITTGVNGSAGRTWQDIVAEFPTWNDVIATYATWENLLLDRRG